MAYTYSKLATVTLASTSSSINFIAIPQNYTDLVIKYSLRDNRTNTVFENVYMTFNGVGGTSYTQRLLRGSGSAVASFTDASAAQIQYHYSTAASATTSTFSSGEVYIPNYTASTNKSVSIDNVTENNAAEAYQSLTAGIFVNTTPITSIALAAGVAFTQHSTATLYGIKAEV